MQKLFLRDGWGQCAPASNFWKLGIVQNDLSWEVHIRVQVNNRQYQQPQI